MGLEQVFAGEIGTAAFGFSLAMGACAETAPNHDERGDEQNNERRKLQQRVHSKEVGMLVVNFNKEPARC
jgi:hypothetical protein